MSAKSTSTKVFWLVAALAAVLAASLLCGAQPAWADSAQYIERSWDADSKQVVSMPKTAECTPITSGTVDIGGETPGWYVVNGDITIDHRLVVQGVANIILTDGSKLTVEEGISVLSDRTLNIYGQAGDSGELIALVDTNDNAAIGADNEQGDCGTVTIHGGKVTADAYNADSAGDPRGTDGAGIGGGDEGNGGIVTIYGGTVTARGSDYAAGIGGGDADGVGGNGGTVKIYDGTVTATGGTDSAGIGGGEGGNGGSIEIHGGTVTAKGGISKGDRIGPGAGIGGGEDGASGDITITGGTVTATGGVNSAGIGGAYGGNFNMISISGGKVKATGGKFGAGIGSGMSSSGTIGGTINISGDADIEASGGIDGAGIGGGEHCTGGTINISGGTIKATGGTNTDTILGSSGGAGIGGGDGAKSGNITIMGGTIDKAQGGRGAAGIGSGDGATFDTISISGGKVIANGGRQGAGIGGGDKDSYTAGEGTITISGTANVEATGGEDAAGIGGGQHMTGGTINITGGKVKATGGTKEGAVLVDRSGGAGIGGGYGCNGENITISGGNTEATGGANAAGIGNGTNGHDNATTITLTYQDGDYDISIKASSYRNSNEDETTTVIKRRIFMDRDTRDFFPTSTTTGSTLDQLNGRTLVYDNTYAVNVSEMQHGRVVPDSSRALQLEYVGFTVTPDEGWELKPGTLKVNNDPGYKLPVNQDASDPSRYTFLMPPANVTITAEFVQRLAVESISLNKDATTLYVEDEETLVATVLPDGSDTTVVDKTVTWKSSDENVATVDAGGKVIAVAAGEATITATATNGTEDTADDKTATCTVTVIKTEVEAPTIASKVYNGEVQTADVEASDLYDVTANEGHTNAGAYDVVLTLKNPAKYKWPDSDEAVKTLTFEITKAENKVSVSLEGWACNEQANDPVVEADFGADTATIEYKAKDADDEAYSIDKPTEPGDYTVRATIAESTNYRVASATADFTIGDPIMVTLTLIGSSIDGKDNYDPYVVQVPKYTSLADFYTEHSDEAYKHFKADDSQYRYYGVFSMTKPLTEFSSWGEVRAEDESLVASKKFDEDTTLYVPLAKYVDTIALSVERPACGTEVKIVRDPDTSLLQQENAPKVTIGADAHMPIKSRSLNPKWIDPDSGYGDIFVGTIENGKTCRATVELGVPDFGYTLDPDRRPEVISVENAVEGSVEYDGYYGVTFDVAVFGHKWGAATYIWSSDNKTVTATHSCSACKHAETEKVTTTSKVTKQPTCENKGETTYTSEAFENEAFKVQTKKVANIDAIGHDYGAWTKVNNKQHQKVCNHDKTHVVKEAHTWDAGKVTKPATEKATGIKTYTCSVCKGTKTEVIPKITPALTLNAPTKQTQVSSRNLQLKVTIKKEVKNATGYRIQYRQAGTTKWTTKTAKNMVYTVKGLKAKGLYDVRAVAVNTKAGKTVVGKYSTPVYRYTHNVGHTLKAGKGSIVVNWRKDAKATGYLIKYADNKNMKNAKTIKVVGKNKASYTIKKLKKGKTYYVAVRPYVTYKGHDYIGSSGNRSAKVK